MKKILLATIAGLICFSISFAQTPQFFQYQSVVRNSSGDVIQNQNMNFRTSIIAGNPGGPVLYTENHSAATNNYGIANLRIGDGAPLFGNFATIAWGSDFHFLQVEVDPTGGTNYLDMGTTQLLSVPYALYAEQAGNVQTYSAGNGISITGNVITNEAPDQPVTLTPGGATTITGAYPNFTISSTDNNTTYTAGSGINISGTTITNTAPDQAVTLTPGGATTITGTYPNFTISSTDNNTTYIAGTAINITGTTINNTAPDQAVTLTPGGATTITGTYPNFTISSTDNNTTYTAGTAINITGTTINNTAPDQTVTLTQGGATTVTGTYPNFTISSTDNNTTYTAGTGMTLSGTIFNAQTTTALWNANQIQGRSVSSSAPSNGQVLGWNGSNWLPANDLNTGTPGGLNKTVQFNNSGSFGGDTALVWDNTNKRLGVGIANPAGRMIVRGSNTAPPTEPLFEVKNAQGQTVFVVYPDSVHIYVKDDAAKSNKGGFAVSGRNTSKQITSNFLTVTPDSTRIFTGDSTLGFGVQQIGTGTSTSYMNLTPLNYFIGHQAGNSITSGKYNSFLGFQSGMANTSGNRNTFLGYKAGFSNTTGQGNIFLGPYAGYSNQNGNYNTFIGDSCGYFNVMGWYNTFLGYEAGAKNTSSNNTFIGTGSGNQNVAGMNNTFLGNSSGFFNQSGNDNTCVGLVAGCYMLGNENTYIGTQSGFNNNNGSRNTMLGKDAGYDNTGSGNIFIGYAAGRNDTGSNRLFIENSNVDSLSALIFGNFASNIVRINGKIGVGTHPQYKVHSVDATTGTDAPAVYGIHAVTEGWGIGVQGVGKYMGVKGDVSTNSVFESYGGYFTSANTGTGTSYGLYSLASGNGIVYAGYFQGNVHVNGTLSKSAGTFKIDHPLDPENKYLVHSFVESPDMKNVYDGVVILNSAGEAEIELPSYFDALNENFRYQLTPVGSPSNLYIKSEINNNKFVIAGGTSGLKVCWQVTGSRKDPYARKYPVVVEQEKTQSEKGLYLNPELFNKGNEKFIHKQIK